MDAFTRRDDRFHRRLFGLPIGGPAFGALCARRWGQYQVYGLIYDIHIDDDGLVRQLVTAETSAPR